MAKGFCEAPDEDLRDRVTALETKTSSSFVGNATGVNTVSISNIGDYTSLTVLIIFERNQVTNVMSFNIPKVLIDALTSGTYRFFRAGDTYSCFIVGVTNSFIVLNTALFLGENIINTTSIYVYKN